MLLYSNVIILRGFTWDALLNHMHIRFELLTDIDMVMFIKHGIRDGLNVLADMHKLITSTCVRTIHRNCHRTLCITT